MIDEATGYKLCKRGHVRSPENVDKKGACRECIKARQQTPEYKACRKAYDKARVRDLANSYVADLLGIATSEAPQDLIEIKRLTIQLQRSLKRRGHGGERIVRP